MRPFTSSLQARDRDRRPKTPESGCFGKTQSDTDRDSDRNRSNRGQEGRVLGVKSAVQAAPEMVIVQARRARYRYVHVRESVCRRKGEKKGREIKTQSRCRFGLFGLLLSVSCLSLHPSSRPLLECRCRSNARSRRLSVVCLLWLVYCLWQTSPPLFARFVFLGGRVSTLNMAASSKELQCHATPSSPRLFSSCQQHPGHTPYNLGRGVGSQGRRGSGPSPAFGPAPLLRLSGLTHQSTLQGLMGS